MQRLIDHDNNNAQIDRLINCDNKNVEVSKNDSRI